MPRQRKRPDSRRRQGLWGADSANPCLEHIGGLGTGDLLAGDCDGDGIPNLAEYAFALDPHTNSCGLLPHPQRIGDRFELRYSRAQLAHDIEYAAEWSPDLSPGSWRDVPDSGNAGEHVFSMPTETAPRLFMRHRVSSKTQK